MKISTVAIRKYLNQNNFLKLRTFYQAGLNASFSSHIHERNITLKFPVPGLFTVNQELEVYNEVKSILEY